MIRRADYLIITVNMSCREIQSRRDCSIEPRVGRASDLPWVNGQRVRSSTLKGLHRASNRCNPFRVVGLCFGP